MKYASKNGNFTLCIKTEIIIKIYTFILFLDIVTVNKNQQHEHHYNNNNIFMLGYTLLLTVLFSTLKLIFCGYKY